MATKSEIKTSRQKVLEEIDKRIKENPNIGIHECVEKTLDTMGVSHEGKKEIELKEVVEGLNHKQQKIVRSSVDLYKKTYDGIIAEYQRGSKSSLKKIPKAIVETLAKGGSIGAGFAGVVNTIAPNLFPVAASYFAGASQISGWQKFLILIGASVAPEPISKGAIIGIGAATGALTYGTGKVVKGIYKKIQQDKER